MTFRPVSSRSYPVQVVSRITEDIRFFKSDVVWSRMFWITTFCSVLLAVGAESNNIGRLEPYQAEYNMSAISCIVKMCDQYYYSKTETIGSLLVVHVQNMTPSHNQIVKMLMERNIYSIDLINQYTRCSEDCFYNFAVKAKNYLLAFEELEDVVAALRLWRKFPTWNPLGQFVAVFINQYDHHTLHKHIRLVLEAFFEFHVLNVKLISFEPDSNLIQMHTWYPYEGDNCANGVQKIHMIDECAYTDGRSGPETVRNLKPLQPIIPTKLHDCPLRVATSVYEPYVFYDSFQKSFYRGIEVHLIRAVAKALKMTPIYIRINETRAIRVVSNETGLYSMLLKRYIFKSVLIYRSNRFEQSNY